MHSLSQPSQATSDTLYSVRASASTETGSALEGSSSSSSSPTYRSSISSNAAGEGDLDYEAMTDAQLISAIDAVEWRLDEEGTHEVGRMA